MTFRLPPGPVLLKCRSALLGLSFMVAAGLCRLSAADPSMRESVSFIEDKVNQQGVVNVAGYLHDNASGKDSITRQSWEQTRFRIDPQGKCRLDYHKKIATDGNTTEDSNFFVVLKAVNKVEVLPIEQAWKLFDSRKGSTTLNYRADPAVSVVRLDVSDGTYLDLAFYDRDLAQRVQKAMAYLVKNCGGGREAF